MATYEFIREIFNECSNNQMRDVVFREVEISDVDSFMQQYRTGAVMDEQRTVESDGTIVYDLVVDGLRQRFSFTEV